MSDNFELTLVHLPTIISIADSVAINTTGDSSDYLHLLTTPIRASDGPPAHHLNATGAQPSWGRHTSIACLTSYMKCRHSHTPKVYIAFEAGCTEAVSTGYTTSFGTPKAGRIFTQT